MTEYTITVIVGASVAGSGFTTGAQVRDALEALPEGQRLDAAFIDNMPSVTGGYSTPSQVRDALQTLTGTSRLAGSAVKDVLHNGAEAVAALEALTAGNRLSATKLDDLTKFVVLGCQFALNLRGSGNIWADQSWRDETLTQIKKGDFWLQIWPFAGDQEEYPYEGTPPEPPVATTPVMSGDWFIALQNQSGSITQTILTDTTKWLRMPFGQLYPTTYTWPTWGGMQDAIVGKEVRMIQKPDQEGFVFYGSGSTAEGTGATAMGRDNEAEAVDSFVTGNSAKARNAAGKATATGKINAAGDLQVEEYQLYAATFNNTKTAVTTPQNPVLPANALHIIKGACTILDIDAGTLREATVDLAYIIEGDNTITELRKSITYDNDDTAMTVDVNPEVVGDNVCLCPYVTGHATDTVRFHWSLTQKTTSIYQELT